MMRAEEDVSNLIEDLEEVSVLKFTHAPCGTDGSLPFLDVLVNKVEDRLHMQVYVKPTDAGECMKANSECPDRYKRSVINNYLTRAYKVSSSWNDFDLEIQRIKQLLINNGYTNNMFDFCLNTFLNYKFHLPISSGYSTLLHRSHQNTVG